jgi:hypothetical protein
MSFTSLGQIFQQIHFSSKPSDHLLQNWKELLFWRKYFTYIFRIILITKTDFFPIAYCKGDYEFVVMKELILLQM